MHDKLAYVIKHYPWVQRIYRIVMSFLLRVMGCFTGFDDHLVLLSSMSGDQFSGSPKVLFDAMQKDPRFAGFHYVWAFSHPEQHHIPGADVVKMDSPAISRLRFGQRSGLRMSISNGDCASRRSRPFT